MLLKLKYMVDIHDTKYLGDLRNEVKSNCHDVSFGECEGGRMYTFESV